MVEGGFNRRSPIFSGVLAVLMPGKGVGGAQRVALGQTLKSMKRNRRVKPALRWIKLPQYSDSHG